MNEYLEELGRVVLETELAAEREGGVSREGSRGDDGDWLGGLRGGNGRRAVAAGGIPPVSVQRGREGMVGHGASAEQR